MKKRFFLEEGTDEEFTLGFSGDCKWDVDMYTNMHPNIFPLSQEKIKEISNGFGMDYPLIQKSILLDVEIWCNSKDIDEDLPSCFQHYRCGLPLKDRCPKILKF